MSETWPNKLGNPIRVGYGIEERTTNVRSRFGGVIKTRRIMSLPKNVIPISINVSKENVQYLRAFIFHKLKGGSVELNMPIQEGDSVSVETGLIISDSINYEYAISHWRVSFDFECNLLPTPSEASFDAWNV